MKTVKYILLLIVLVTIGTLQAQSKYIDKKGTLTFEASEALFEPVKAKNESVTAILNAETNEIASLALVKGFRFKNSLMEEHFNENYIESETYPKATFRGQLIDIDLTTLSEKEIEVTVDGKIALHGKEKQIKTILNISKSGDIIHIRGEFIVSPADFDIEIPSVVRDKIAKDVKVYIEFKLAKK